MELLCEGKSRYIRSMTWVIGASLPMSVFFSSIKNILVLDSFLDIIDSWAWMNIFYLIRMLCSFVTVKGRVSDWLCVLIGFANRITNRHSNRWTATTRRKKKKKRKRRRQSVRKKKQREMKKRMAWSECLSFFYLLFFFSSHISLQLFFFSVVLSLIKSFEPVALQLVLLCDSA